MTLNFYLDLDNIIIEQRCAMSQQFYFNRPGSFSIELDISFSSSSAMTLLQIDIAFWYVVSKYGEEG